jgi:tetratricopeptide (TPR) repeat protein
MGIGQRNAVVSRAASLGAVALAVLLPAAGPLAQPPPAVPDPDLTGAEPQVAAKIEAARRFAGSNPESAHAWGVLAMSLDVHGFDREALAAYERAAAFDPAELRWPYFRAITLAELGDPAALAEFERARELAPAYPPLLVRMGRALAAAGRMENAREAFLAALVSGSDTPGPRAEAPLEPRIETDAAAHLELARLELASGGPEAALDHARSAVAAAGRSGRPSAEALALLAELLRRSGDADGAARVLAVARAAPEGRGLTDPVYDRLGAEGVSSFWYRRRGRAYLEAGRYAEAAEELGRAVGAAPLAGAHDDLGLALLYLGRGEEAIVHHRAALELEAETAAVRTHLAEALAASGRLEEAVAETERALELDPAHLPAWLDLGTFHQRAGHRRAAADAFRRGLALSPADLRMTSRLAWLLATAPEPYLRSGTEAVRLAEEAARTTGGSVPEVLDVLAAAYAEAGRFEDAAGTARRALELARAHGRSNLADEIAARLTLYEDRRPFREGRP